MPPFIPQPDNYFDEKAFNAVAQAYSVVAKGFDGTNYPAIKTSADGTVQVAGTVTVSGATTTQYTEGDVDSTITGTAVMWEDTGDTLRAVSAAKPLPISDAGGSLTVDGTVAISGAVPVTDNGGSLTVDGTVDVSSVGGTVTVAGTVTANAGSGTFVVGDGGGSLSIDDNGGSITVDGTVAVTQPVAVTDNGGSLTVDGTVAVSGTVTVAGTVAVSSVAGTVTIAGAVTNAGTFAVQDSQVITDNAGFTDGTSKVFAAGYIFDEVAGTALTENDAAASRIDSKRAQICTIEDETTRGRRATVTAGLALKTDSSAVTQPVSGTVSVSGTVTVDSELPAAAALTDTTANPTVPGVGAFNELFNGSTWDRMRGDITNGLDVDVTRVTGTVTIAGAVTNAGTFAVQDSEKVVDNAAFTDGTTKVQPAGFIFDEVAGTALTENDAAAARIDSKRAQVFVLEDATTRGQRALIDSSGLVGVNIRGATVTVPTNSADIIKDNSAFTDGASNLYMAGYIFDETAGTALTENDAAAARLDSKRAQICTIEDETTRGRRATVTAGLALKVDNSAVTQPVAGDVANDGVDSGNPIKMGGKARNAYPTAVANSDRVDAAYDLFGRQHVAPQHDRVFLVRQTATLTSTTAETTLITAGAAGVFNDLNHLICSNVSATASRLDFRDATAGTIRFAVYLPATTTVSISFPAGAPSPQTTAANNWTVQSSASVNSISVQAVATQAK